MEDLVIALAYFVGRITRIVLVSTVYTLVVGALFFIPFRKRHYWRIVISAWFMFFAWQVFKVTAGHVFGNTFSRPQAFFVGTVFFVIVATTPIVLFASLTRRATRWVYAIGVLCLVGAASPILDIVFAVPLPAQSSSSPKPQALSEGNTIDYITALRQQWEQEARSAGVTFKSQGEYTEQWQNRLFYEYMTLRETFDHNKKNKLAIHPELRRRLVSILEEVERISVETGNDRQLKFTRDDLAEIREDRDQN